MEKVQFFLFGTILIWLIASGKLRALWEAFKSTPSHGSGIQPAAPANPPAAPLAPVLPIQPQPSVSMPTEPLPMPIIVGPTGPIIA